MSDAAAKVCPTFCLNRLVAALYRKYRPQSFEEVVGQEAVVRTLSNAIGTDAVRQVYILDEAHQLTDAVWNALLKLIEEPPPHLVFVFCTSELSKVLPTVRSWCKTFVFSRPRLTDLVRKLRRIADDEGIEAPDAALSLIAR